MTKRSAYRYKVVDVFTRVPLEGNPLAVFPDSQGLDGIMMQRIARELNLSETVFFEEPTISGCVKSFRIFTPAREIVFAGHPTVGASYVLIAEGLVPKGTSQFSVQERIGPISIGVEMSDLPLIWLETPTITFNNTLGADSCSAALGLKGGDLLDIKPQIVDAGNPTLLVALRDRSIVDRAVLDVRVFCELQAELQESFCMFVFTPTGQGAYSRMFAPHYGIPEDPATGSSTGPLAAFMKRHNLLPQSGIGRFVSEQGTKMGRRSLLYFEVSETDSGDRISVGGNVTPLIEAVLTV
jgi:trans-2,3-dihydro-3-hydroxyanthranilate isomerase